MGNRTSWAAGALHWLLVVVGALVSLAAMAVIGMQIGWWASASFRAQVLDGAAKEGVTPDIMARMIDGTLFPILGLALLLPLLLLWLLWRIVGRVRRGDPFAAENPRDIYYVAGLLALLEAGSWLAQAVFPLASRCGTHGPTFDLHSLLPILMAVVLAEVFREGNRLRDDVAGTV